MRRLEPAQPAATRSPATADGAARWRAAIEALLRVEWHSAATARQQSLAGEAPDYAVLAATLVGMFDAGARDAEVAAFLAQQERAATGAEWLEPHARLALVARLHRAAR